MNIYEDVVISSEDSLSNFVNGNWYMDDMDEAIVHASCVPYRVAEKEFLSEPIEFTPRMKQWFQGLYREVIAEVQLDAQIDEEDLPPLAPPPIINRDPAVWDMVLIDEVGIPNQPMRRWNRLDPINPHDYIVEHDDMRRAMRLIGD